MLSLMAFWRSSTTLKTDRIYVVAAASGRRGRTSNTVHRVVPGQHEEGSAATGSGSPVRRRQGRLTLEKRREGAASPYTCGVTVWLAFRSKTKSGRMRSRRQRFHRSRNQPDLQ
jgi:hypothetical protein